MRATGGASNADRIMTENGTLTLSGDVAVSTILDRPPDAVASLVLAHGAGAGMRHHFMERLAGAVAERGLAVFRYQFPYLEAGRRRVDSPALAEQTVRAAVAAVRQALPELRRLLAERGRDPAALHVVPMGVLPEPAKLDYYASLGVTECVLRLPSAPRDAVMPVLDDYAHFVGAR